MISLETPAYVANALTEQANDIRKKIEQLLPKLMEIGIIDTATNAWEERQKIGNDYLEPALQVYFSRLGVNPFGEVEK